MVARDHMTPVTSARVTAISSATNPSSTGIPAYEHNVSTVFASPPCVPRIDVPALTVSHADVVAAEAGPPTMATDLPTLPTISLNGEAIKTDTINFEIINIPSNQMKDTLCLPMVDTSENLKDFSESAKSVEMKL